MSNENIENRFTESVTSFSIRNGLFKTDCKYLVALSGGADSVALLLVMKKMGIDTEAVTCNFHLRGKESDRDENFCVALCERLGIKLHRSHFDTRSYAEARKISIEMAARELRYRYFEQLRQDIGAEAICVAHHQDDSIETLLMNLIRGTGINGLKGIQPINGHIIRPLLCVGRKDIEDYLNSLGQDYVTDSTNLVDDVMRNKIRLNVIPLLETINPNVRKNIFSTSLNISESIKVFDSSISRSVTEVLNAGKIDISKLKSQPSPEYALFHILRIYNFSPAVIRQIFEHMEGSSGRRWYSEDYELLSDRGYLLIRKRNKSFTMRHMKVIEPGVYVYGENLKFTFIQEIKDADYKIDKSSVCACLDAGRIEFPLTIRPLQNGDRFCPLGMRGSKLISDYMTDIKRSGFEKEEQLVITNANGEIMWLVNERPDNRYKVTDKTNMILKIVLKNH